MPSQIFKLICKFMSFCFLLLINNSFFLKQFVFLLHGNLLMKCFFHLINHRIVSYLLGIHNLPNHFVIYHHLVHLLVKYVHLVWHIFKIEVSHLLSCYVSQVAEGVDKHLIVFHWFYLSAHVLHLQCSSLAC